MERLLRTARRLFQPQPSFQIQVISDLHLEIGQQYSSFTFPASAPFLLLGGDIGRLVDYDAYLGFLAAQVSRYDKVFLVLGNHEFYDLDYETGINKAHRLAEEPALDNKLILINKTRWDDPNSDVTILGCTLWSNIPSEAHAIVESKISDFKKIQGWSVQKHNAVHIEEVTWLREQVAALSSSEQSRKRRILILTHHAPSLKGTSRPEHANNPWTPAFASPLVEGKGWEGVRTWVFGHTHYSTDFRQNGMRLVANQRGYVFPGSASKEEKGKKGAAHVFDAAMVISL